MPGATSGRSTCKYDEVPWTDGISVGTVFRGCQEPELVLLRKVAFEVISKTPVDLEP